MGTLTPFQTNTDLFLAPLPKAPGGLSEFHSWHELAYAYLLEADSDVSRFRSQPVQVPYVAGNREEWHVPDFWVERQRESQIVEVKTQENLEKSGGARLAGVKNYCQRNDYEFVLVSNDSIESKRTKVLNWMRITSGLMAGADLDTSRHENSLLKNLRRLGEMPVYNIFTFLHAIPRPELWLTLFRLLHRHDIECDLQSSPLTEETILYPR